MTRTLSILAVAAGLSLTACNSNTAPGNDKEAELDAPAKAAPQANAAAALEGIATGAVQPETMTPADLASLGGIEGRCVIRLTEVGAPSLVYGGSQTDATVKLNGKLITLPSAGNGKYADGGLMISVTPVAAPAGERRETEMVVMLPGAKNELGFRGYSVCDGVGGKQ